MRFLGLDVGDKRIGVAMSDSLGTFASCLEVINWSNWKTVKARLQEIINEYQITLIVVGLPKNMDGTLGLQARKVISFASMLEEETKIGVVLWDERLSSKSAETYLIQDGVSRKDRKQAIDMISACIILQNYIDRIQRDGV
jgi:putative Holliday junction resolvase